MQKLQASTGRAGVKDFIVRKLLAPAGAIGILVGIGAAIFFFGGFFSVATTASEPGIMDWALISVRTASIERHATAKPPAGLLEDAARVEAGAKLYSESGCVNCHGGPGVEWARFSEGLRPDAPDLVTIGQQLTPAEVFWVIKHGINMTGMPEFGSMPEKDMWSVVAFVKNMSKVKGEDFKSWNTVVTAEK